MDQQCREAARRDQFVAIGMHVPTHKNQHPDRGWYVKPENGQSQCYELLVEHRDRVLMLMHGHFHNGIRGWDDHPPLQEIAFPSALYNQNRRLEEQQAGGYNLPEFRPGFTHVAIRDSAVELTYQPVGADEAIQRKCRLPQLKSS